MLEQKGFHLGFQQEVALCRWHLATGYEGVEREFLPMGGPDGGVQVVVAQGQTAVGAGKRPAVIFQSPGPAASGRP